MYYIYFPFVVILAGLMILECHVRDHPKWYAAAVLIAPVTTPFFILKTRKEEGLVLVMIFMTLFSAVCAGEIVLFSMQKERAKFGAMTPITKKMMALTEKIRKDSNRLDNGLIKLEDLSKVESRPAKIFETIQFISELRVIMTDYMASVDELETFAQAQKGYFLKKNMEWIFHIKEFYHDYAVIQHRNSLEEYLDSFEDLLTYTYQNFDAIDKAKSPKHLKNYDEYYLRYRRAVDAHNRFNVKRMEFQNKFLEQYPELTPYLPGKSQPEAFRLWG